MHQYILPRSACMCSIHCRLLHVQCPARLSTLAVYALPYTVPIHFQSSIYCCQGWQLAGCCTCSNLGSVYCNTFLGYILVHDKPVVYLVCLSTILNKTLALTAHTEKPWLAVHVNVNQLTSNFIVCSTYKNLGSTCRETDFPSLGVRFQYTVVCC